MSLAVSNLNGSKKLLVSNFSNASKVISQRAEQRRAQIEEQRSMNPVTSVERVSSVTGKFEGIVTGTYAYTRAGKTTTKISLLIVDATKCYTGTEEELSPSKGKNGETVPALIKFDKKTRSVWLPVGKASNFQETFEKWRAKGVELADVEPYFEFKSPSRFEAKLDLTSPGEPPAIHEPVEVTISVFAYLPPAEIDSKNPGSEVRVPSAVGLSLRVHVLKKKGPSNSPLLFNVIAFKPSLIGLPVLSYPELKKIDVELHNKSKDSKSKDSKPSLIGSLIITIPCLCGVTSFEEKILELEDGTLGTLEFLVSGDKVPWRYTKKDGENVTIADLVLTLTQWRGKKTERHVVTMRLWSENIEIFGCAEINNWTMGIGEAIMKQTPTFYSGKIMHTDSDEMMRAKNDDTVASVMALHALQPVADLPGSISGLFGVPVSAKFAAHMVLFQKRNGPSAPATPHPLCTFAQPSTFKENLYNNQSGSMMLVLNELEPSARAAVFQDEESKYLFFAVVAKKIMNDSDRETLKELRALQEREDYSGPLGEMLTWPNWNPSDPSKWKTAIYGKDASEPHCVVPADHPVVVAKQGTFATNPYFYLYAISTTRYNAALSMAQASNFFALEQAPVQSDLKRDRDSKDSDNDNDDDDDDDNEESNKKLRLI